MKIISERKNDLIKVFLMNEDTFEYDASEAAECFSMMLDAYRNFGDLMKPRIQEKYPYVEFYKDRICFNGNEIQYLISGNLHANDDGEFSKYINQLVKEF